MGKNLFYPTEYIENKRFKLLGTSKTKESAKKRAEYARSKGYNARVLKKNTGTSYKYGIYTHRK